MRPFSSSEKKYIIKLLEELGFRPDITPKNNERYSIIDNESLIVITIKKPVYIGLNLNIPFEVCSFYYSYFFRPRMINSNTLEMINFMATNLLNISQNMVLDHKFPIEDLRTQNKFIQLLNKFMPETYPDETEYRWITRVRVSLMNKYNLFSKVEKSFFKSLLSLLGSIGLVPTWNLPVTLRNGIPKLKRASTIFYTNQEDEEHEYFIAEKGFFTFERNFSLKNIQLRCMFESYTPLLLELIFQDVTGFSVKDLILSWIRFSRMSLNPLINVVDTEYINGREFYPINLNLFFERDLSSYSIPIPALARERQEKDEIFKPNNEILDSPPRSFDELEAISKFLDTEDLIKNGKLQEAIKNLTKLLITFNRYGQKSGVIKTLFKLADIGENMGKFNESHGYLKDALEVCKSGEVPLPLIIQTHEKIGDLQIHEKDYEIAEHHFQIIIKFLKEQKGTEFDTKIQLTNLKIAKIFVETERMKDANVLFRQIFKIGEKNSTVMANYYLERTNYYMKKNSISNAIQTLKKGILLEEKEDVPKIKLAEILFELGKLYIYERNLSKRAQQHLETADKLLDERRTPDLLLKVKIFETLSDVFNNSKDFDNMKYYSERARQIIKILQLRGYY